jgi:hypothetical protein
VAAELTPMLQERLPGVEIFFTPTSIEPGSDPSRRMFDEGLLVSDALVVVLTEESAGSAYVIWETTAASARSAAMASPGSPSKQCSIHNGAP